VRVIGYARVSTGEQGRSGLGLQAQETAILGVRDRGWEVIGIETDVASGRGRAGRDGLSRAIERVEKGEAGGLVVTKLDRLARSVIDGADLLRRADQRGWSLVVLELGLDTSTAIGKFGAHIWLAAAEMERALIGQRTREALTEARRRGTRLGRPSGTFEVAPAVEAVVLRERAEGRSYRDIASRLDREGVQSARGRRWSPESVRRVVLRKSVTTS
jgi:DNA invertase Pin-like site-specific DNA recombinase